MESFLELFPVQSRMFWEETGRYADKLQEIRLRADKPVLVTIAGREYGIDASGRLTGDVRQAHRITQTELEQYINHFCNYSLYAYEEELRQGFITVAGGHRIGVTGQVVLGENGQPRTIQNISCINIRIAHEIKGAADKVLPHIYESGRLCNVLIVSPPGCGKTTLLRDLIRQVSDGNAYGSGMNVSVVDERSEIGGAYRGQPQNDLGIRTDLMDACPKVQGMLMLLRGMSPRVVAVDELGDEREIELLRNMSYCGVSLLATAHGEDMEDVKSRLGLRDGGDKLFTRFILLGKESSKPVVKQIVKGEEGYVSHSGSRYGFGRMLGIGMPLSGSVSYPFTEPENHEGDIGTIL